MSLFHGRADDRLIPFAPNVRRAMEELTKEPPPRDPKDYVPPDHREQAVPNVRAADHLPGIRPPDYHVDMDKIESVIGADPVSDLRRQIMALTYGEMMETCGGILSATENKPISTADELAKVIHRWATKPRESPRA